MAHTITISWIPSVDMANPIPAGDGYNVYRGTVPGAEGATPINGTTPVASNTYIDSNVTIGTYDYFVETIINGASSGPSVQVSAVILPAAPTGLTAVAV